MNEQARNNGMDNPNTVTPFDNCKVTVEELRQKPLSYKMVRNVNGGKSLVREQK